jgi:hypothetical protein
VEGVTDDDERGGPGMRRALVIPFVAMPPDDQLLEDEEAENAGQYGEYALPRRHVLEGFGDQVEQ